MDPTSTSSSSSSPERSESNSNVPDGVKVYTDPESGRRLIQVHYTALGPDVAERIRRNARKLPGGLLDPEFLADYELNLRAQPGDLIFRSFDPRLNVEAFNPVFEGQHLLSFDFGFDHPTCILAAEHTPRQIRVYFEHYMSGASSRVHKARLRAGLARLNPPWQREPPGSNFFDFYEATGDVSGLGYKAEYAEDPYPIRITFPSHEPNWKERSGGESVLDGFFRRMKRCCWRVWPEDMKRCEVCKQKLEVLPGLVIHPRCKKTIEEIPSQVIDEGKRANVPDHAVDALRYLALRCLSFRKSAPSEPKKEPWWLKGARGEPEEVDPEIEEAYAGNESVVRFFR